MDFYSDYADDWTKSAKHFYDRGDYKWAAGYLPSKGAVLEIGCGTGYSSLSILEHGNTVVGVDKNMACINKARQLLSSKPELKNKYTFYEADVLNKGFHPFLTIQFD